jgi:hypothetical protein
MARPARTGLALQADGLHSPCAGADLERLLLEANTVARKVAAMSDSSSGSPSGGAHALGVIGELDVCADRFGTPWQRRADEAPCIDSLFASPCVIAFGSARRGIPAIRRSRRCSTFCAAVRGSGAPSEDFKPMNLDRRSIEISDEAQNLALTAVIAFGASKPTADHRAADRRAKRSETAFQRNNADALSSAPTRLCKVKPGGKVNGRDILLSKRTTSSSREVRK